MLAIGSLLWLRWAFRRRSRRLAITFFNTPFAWSRRAGDDWRAGAKGLFDIGSSVDRTIAEFATIIHRIHSGRLANRSGFAHRLSSGGVNWVGRRDYVSCFGEAVPHAHRA